MVKDLGSGKRLGAPTTGHLLSGSEMHGDGDRLHQPSLVSRAIDVFGEPLAEVIITHDERHLVGLERIVAQSSDRQLQPLVDAVEIAAFLKRKVANETVQAWFVGLNPILGDREPALTVRDNPDAVRRAAKAFLASG